MNLKVPLALLLSFCIFLPVLAQTLPPPPPPPQQKRNAKNDDVVKITTNLVQVDAVVTKDGKVVPNLTADDFEIYEDGKRQTIISFAYISNVSNSTPPGTTAPEKGAPATPIKRNDPHRTIAFVVDDLGLSAESMVQVKKQLRKFVAEQLGPRDLVAVVRTSGEWGALQQFTNDKRVLNRSVDQLRWNFCNRVGIHVFRPAGMPSYSFCGQRSYLDTLASLRYILGAMGQLPGRKSMVLLSDSMPSDSKDDLLGNDGPESSFGDDGKYAQTNYVQSLNRIAEKAIRSSVVIYSVDTQGLAYTGATAADYFPATIAGSTSQLGHQMEALLTTRRALLDMRRAGAELLSFETGGFQVRDSNDFQFSRIVEDQNGYYLIGYRPTEETFNRSFHKIKAKVKGSGMTLRTRSGFYGVSEEDAASAQPSSAAGINLALASPFVAQDFEVNLASFFTDDKTTGSVVRSFVYIPVNDLEFENVDGRRRGSVELHGVIFGENGVVVEQRSRSGNLSLSEGEYRYAVRNGIALRLDMPVKRPGSYQVRVVARDKASSKIGSAGQFVVVPDLNKKKIEVSGIVLGTAARFSGPDVSQIIETPGMRRFELNSDLHFAFVVYNAMSANSLVMEARLFRDGKKIYSGLPAPIVVGNQPDPNRLFVNGAVRLGQDLAVGNYYLQIVITDRSAKNKASEVVQWIDFEVIKEARRLPR